MPQARHRAYLVRARPSRGRPRDIQGKERLAVPWREILWALRRLEARGLIRGGRFVTGEQFADETTAHLLHQRRGRAVTERLASLARTWRRAACPNAHRATGGGEQHRGRQHRDDHTQRERPAHARALGSADAVEPSRYESGTGTPA
ncbi:Lhr family helicase [Candidatus Solirubrobacter pratensis]